MLPISLSAITAAVIGFSFGAFFAVRAIQVSELQPHLADMLRLSGWLGGLFGLLFLLLGLGVSFGSRMFFGRQVASASLRTRAWLFSWIVIGCAIAVPFLGYFLHAGVEVGLYEGAASPWDLLPIWMLRIGRWVAFSMLTAAVLAFAASEALPLIVRGRRSTRRVAVVAIGLALAMWLIPPIVMRVSVRKAPDPVATRSDARDPVGPILIVGWDGATWDVIDPLLEVGRLPALRSLIDRGVRAPLNSFEPTSSPLIWTTIATGRPPSQHGVRAQVENRFRGMDRWFFFTPFMGFDHVFGPVWERAGFLDRVQITSHARHAKAFWNVLNEAGRTVGLTFWRVGWPAERVRSFNITDHAYAFVSRLCDETQLIPATMTPADVLEQTPGGMEPPVSVDFLNECLAASRVRAKRHAEKAGLPESLVPMGEVFALEVGMRHYEASPVDVLATYFYEIDGIEHRYWHFREPQYFFSVQDEDVAAWGGAIDAMYEFTDGLLGDLLALVPDDTTVILLSDHGHGPVFGELKRTGGHSHAPPGILVVAGPDVDRQSKPESPSVYDIFPTLMYLSGLPIEVGLRGRVLEELFLPEFRDGRVIRTVPSYGRREVEAGAERHSPATEEMIERLRSLGYVG